MRKRKPHCEIQNKFKSTANSFLPKQSYIPMSLNSQSSDWAFPSLHFCSILFIFKYSQPLTLNAKLKYHCFILCLHGDLRFIDPEFLEERPGILSIILPTNQYYFLLCVCVPKPKTQRLTAKLIQVHTVAQWKCNEKCHKTGQCYAAVKQRSGLFFLSFFLSFEGTETYTVVKVM